jgi:hypothetical protein
MASNAKFLKILIYYLTILTKMSIVKVSIHRHADRRRTYFFFFWNTDHVLVQYVTLNIIYI